MTQTTPTTTAPQSRGCADCGRQSWYLWRRGICGSCCNAEDAKARGELPVVRPDGEPYPQAQRLTIADEERKLTSGEYFRLHAAAARSRRGYEPPVSRRQWADAMAAVARMAEHSDAFAQVAASIGINLYGTDSQAAEKIAEAFAEAVRRGFDDVILRTGPDPVRHSAAQRPFTLAETVALALWMERISRPFNHTAPGIGWCVDALARALRITIREA